MLRGVLRQLDDEAAVVDVHGVGWKVALTITDRDRLRLGEVVELQVHTVVREDAIALYGFVDGAARELFLALLGVPGLGPKGAMSLLSELDPPTVARAIHDGDVKTLTRAKGIGKRTAEVIAVQLRERLPASLLAARPASTTRPGLEGVHPAIAREVESALINLGYRSGDATAAVAAVIGTAPERDLNFDALLRAALASLRRDGRPARSPP